MMVKLIIEFSKYYFELKEIELFNEKEGID
jgi:hypothetical protein